MRSSRRKVPTARRYRDEGLTKHKPDGQEATLNTVPSPEQKANDRLLLNGLALDVERRELQGVDGSPRELRKQALDVLLVLAAQAGHVVGKDE